MRKRSRDYDGLLKLLIQGTGDEPFRQLRLGRVEKWLNVDLPRTQHRRVDLLCRTTDGRLVHIELQSTNDPLMGLRMAEYALMIVRRLDQYPDQVVLYVGNEPLRMAPEYRAGRMVCEYEQVDVRDLDGAALLASESIADNTLALLTRLGDSVEGIRTVLRRIARLEEHFQERAIQELLLTCGLRGLERVAIQEIEDMPVFVEFDYTKYPVIVSQVEKAKEKARQEARQEGIKDTLLVALKTRFKRIPSSVIKRVAAMSDAEAQDVVRGIIEGKSLKELFA